MFISFCMYFFLWLFIYLILAKNQINYLNLLASLSIVISICLIYMEFFSMICRGFSLRILTDIYLNKDINQENIKYKYADGKGLEWLFQKRIDSIVKLQLVQINDNIIYLKYPRGYVLSKLIVFFYKIFFIKKGGT